MMRAPLSNEFSIFPRTKSLESTDGNVKESRVLFPAGVGDPYLRGDKAPRESWFRSLYSCVEVAWLTTDDCSAEGKSLNWLTEGTAKAVSDLPA